MNLYSIFESSINCDCCVLPALFAVQLLISKKNLEKLETFCIVYCTVKTANQTAKSSPHVLLINMQ